jgi:hypothetical protein
MSPTDDFKAKTIYLPKELIVELEAEARDQGRSGISAHIRHVLATRAEIKHEMESSAPAGKPDGRRVREWLSKLVSL